MLRAGGTVHHVQAGALLALRVQTSTPFRSDLIFEADTCQGTSHTISTPLP